MNIFAMCAASLVTVILVLTISGTRPEIGIIITICGGVLIMLSALPHVAETISVIKSIASLGGIDMQYIAAALKCSGVGMAVTICSSVCRDGGQTGLATKLEIAGRIMILSVALPIISGLFNAIISAI